MSKRIAYLTAAAFSALAITATVIAPANAEDKKMMKSEMSGDKTVMVGGAPMYPSKNIVENAVNSKDHTTLVAAVKAAGLVETLRRQGPVHGVRADQRGVRQAAGRHRRHAGEAGEQGARSPRSSPITWSPGKLEAADLTDGKKLKTVEGEDADREARRASKVMLIDAKGGSSTVTIAERQPVERRDPRRRHRADAVVTTRPPPSTSPRAADRAATSPLREARAGNPARVFVIGIALRSGE